MRSLATSAAFAVASARIAISVGPASESIPIIPRRARFAAATYIFPGPVTKSHLSATPSIPYAKSATA